MTDPEEHISQLLLEHKRIMDQYQRITRQLNHTLSGLKVITDVAMMTPGDKAPAVAFVNRLMREAYKRTRAYNAVLQALAEQFNQELQDDEDLDQG